MPTTRRVGGDKRQIVTRMGTGHCSCHRCREKISRGDGIGQGAHLSGVLPPRKRLVMSRDICGCHGRNAAPHPAAPRTPRPPQRMTQPQMSWCSGGDTPRLGGRSVEPRRVGVIRADILRQEHGSGSGGGDRGRRGPDAGSAAPSAHPACFQMTPLWPLPRTCRGTARTCLGTVRPRAAVPPTGGCGGR